MIGKLTVQMPDRAIGRPVRHLAALALALEMKLHSFCGRHDSLPRRLYSPSVSAAVSLARSMRQLTGVDLCRAQVNKSMLCGSQ
jgi:hypothetical protein